jgi:hypothetical protein
MHRLNPGAPLSPVAPPIGAIRIFGEYRGERLGVVTIPRIRETA